MQLPDFQAPPYPIIPVVNNDVPDLDRAARFNYDLVQLKGLNQFGEPYSKLEFGGNTLRYFCGYQTMKYRYKTVVKDYGWEIFYHGQWRQVDYDQANWPTWAEPYKDENLKPGSKEVNLIVPMKGIFVIGKQLWYIADWVSPEVACDGWDELRYQWEYGPKPIRHDVLGPRPEKGVYIPVMVIQDDEVEGLYAPPNEEALDIVKHAWRLQLEDPQGLRPGAPVSEQIVREHVTRYYKALHDYEAEQENKLTERINARLDDIIGAAHKTSFTRKVK